MYNRVCSGEQSGGKTRRLNVPLIPPYGTYPARQIAIWRFGFCYYIIDRLSHCFANAFRLEIGGCGNTLEIPPSQPLARPCGSLVLSPPRATSRVIFAPCQG